jgi:hypothetical protein
MPHSSETLTAKAGDARRSRLFIDQAADDAHTQNAVANLGTLNRAHAIAIAVRDAIINVCGGPASV